jgi:cell division protein FtsB
MRLITGALILLLLLLQYPLWIADDGYRAVWRLDNAIIEQRAENAGLEARNQALSAEVEDLKKGTVAAEEIARSELGMIGPDETLYLVADPEPEDRRSIEVP